MKFTALPIPLPATLTESSILKTVTEDSSAPCRRCLTDAKISETVLLTPYNPFHGSSPYTSAGPIFVHYPDCTPYICDGRVPEQQNRRTISIRAFDADHMMVDGVVVPGAELQEKLEDVFGDERVDYVHLHYAGAGCFALRVDR
ncbi:hypothetical protein BJX66DRAFT_344810 [Aspergillus keveii]|uniref:DUF1203 domain-containing protein n=1 Tax=Aspergillus keveii TaxID=714993 RepID=A0ABR4FK18_9EURO